MAMARTSINASSAPKQYIPWPLHRKNVLSCRPHLQTKTVACISDASSGLFEAAKLTVDNFVKSGMVVGLGSGRASGFAVQYLGQQLKQGALVNIVGIPSSISCASEAAKAGVPLKNYQNNSQIDFAFNDADLIEEETLTAIIGRRRLETGESLMEEKSIAKSAGKLAFIVAEGIYTRKIDGSVPVLVRSGNWMQVAEEIDDLFLGDAEVWRRPTFGIGTEGPTGGDFPLVTKEGHHILDLIFTSPVLELGQIAESLEKIDGVVDHGIICNIPCSAIIAAENGVQIFDKKTSVVS